MITIQTPFHIAMAPFEAGRIGIITKIKEFRMYRGLNGAEPVTSPEILLQEAEKPELEDCHNSLLHLVSLLTWTPHCVHLSVVEAPSPVGGGELGHRRTEEEEAWMRSSLEKSRGEGRRWPGSLGGKKMVGGGGAASVIPAPSLSIPSLLDLLKKNCFAKGHWSALETREDC